MNFLIPDKKLTDAEIVKVLECCRDCCCKQCEDEADFQEVIDLINRLQAENERLEHQLETLCLALKLAKAEAYKEFAERLKVYLLLHHGEIYGVLLESIDNILKELVGDNE